MTPEQAEAKTAERLIALLSVAWLDDVTGAGRWAKCWGSDSNGGISIADIFASFEANHTLTPTSK